MGALESESALLGAVTTHDAHRCRGRPAARLA